MEVLSDFPEDIAKALQTSFEILKIFNVRLLAEDDGKPWLKKNWPFSYITVTVLIHVFGLAFHMPQVLAEEEMTQFAYSIPSVLVTIHAVTKSIVFIPKTAQVSAFIKELVDLWTVKYTPNQIKEKETLLWRVNFINRASYWLAVCGTVQYMFSPLFETLFRGFVLKQDFELRLPLASSYPFNPTKNWTIYLLVYIFQLYSMTILVSIYVGAALVMTTSCALLGLQFLMLVHDLAKVKPKLSTGRHYTDEDGLSIESVVERHQKLLRLSRHLDNVFNGLVFIDLLFVGITTCAFSFMGQFSRGPGYMLVSYIGIASSMSTILCLCYYGELLTGASMSIGETAYNTLWYDGDKQYKTTILLINIMSQNPCRLTSLRYAVVSLNMFTKVISTTWSYFSLMNSVYSEEEN